MTVAKRPNAPCGPSPPTPGSDGHVPVCWTEKHIADTPGSPPSGHVRRAEAIACSRSFGMPSERAIRLVGIAGGPGNGSKWIRCPQFVTCFTHLPSTCGAGWVECFSSSVHFVSEIDVRCNEEDKR